jgi:hypothetical protein
VVEKRLFCFVKFVSLFWFIGYSWHLLQARVYAINDRGFILDLKKRLLLFTSHYTFRYAEIIIRWSTNTYVIELSIKMGPFLHLNKNSRIFKILMPVYNQFLCWRLSITPLIHETQQDAKKKYRFILEVNYQYVPFRSSRLITSAASVATEIFNQKKS